LQISHLCSRSRPLSWTGQFRPGDSANPNIGGVGKLEEVQEARVETLCLGEDVVRKAVEALKK
jgi:hypothetical protein